MAKWIKCKKCGHEYMDSIPRCPQCYEKTPVSAAKIAIAVIALVIVAALVVGLAIWNGGAPEGGSSSSDVSSAKPVSSDVVSSEISSQPTSSEESSSVPDPSSSAPVVSYKQPTDSDGNITVKSDGTVCITIPEWLLFLVDPNFDYKLTQEEINEYNFKSVAKNSDGSATYTIGNNDYYRFRLLFGSDVKGTITSIRWLATGRIAQLEENGGVKRIKVYTTHADIDSLYADRELISAVLAAGAQVVVSQYFDMDQSVGSVFEYYSKDDQLLATTTFPDALKQ